MTRTEMVHGLDAHLLQSAAVIAVVALGVALVFVFGLLRTVSRPLGTLRRFTAEVAKGNYDAAIDYLADDDIGRTIGGVRAMVAEIKHRLGFSNGILHGMTMPSYVVDTDARISYVNQAMLDLLGVSGTPDEHLGTDVALFFYGEAGRDTVVGRCMRERRAILNTELTLSRRTGGTVHARLDTAPLLDLDGNLIGAFSIFADLTDIKAHQQEMEDKNTLISEVAAEADRISQVVAEAAAGLARQVEQAERGADVQKARAGEAASAMDQMNASVVEVARAADEAAASADEARAKAEDVIAQVKKGKDFAALAAKLSDDKGSGTQGGDLGWFTKGQMVPPFEAAAFALKPGEVSAPVRTAFGWHVIKLEAHEAQRTRALDEVRGEIRQRLGEEKASERMHEALDTALAKAAKEKDAAVTREVKKAMEQAEQAFEEKFAALRAEGQSAENGDDGEGKEDA